MTLMNTICQSLLGKLYTRIKGSQEDIASEGLVYILSKPKSASATFALNAAQQMELQVNYGI